MKLALALFTVFYVASWGSDARTCLQATRSYMPFKTVARAQQCMRPGDTYKVLG